METPFDSRLLSGLGVLAAVVEAGNFVRAAGVLGLTQSGVSRAVARLEQRVGVRLLDRTSRAVTLTDEGRRFYGRVGPLLTELEEAASDAARASATVRGRLRIMVDPMFARLDLGASLVAFLDAHTELSVDLMKHECIMFRDPATGRPFAWEFWRKGKILTVRAAGRLTLNDAGTLLAACHAGQGIAQMLELGAEGLRDGRLVELFPDWNDERFPLYVFYPSRRLPPAKVRAFVDFVVALTKGA